MNMNDEDRARRRNEVDWTRFGLAEEVKRERRHPPPKYSSVNENKVESGRQDVRELFDEDQVGFLTSWLVGYALKLSTEFSFGPEAKYSEIRGVLIKMLHVMFCIINSSALESAARYKLSLHFTVANVGVLN